MRRPILALLAALLRCAVHAQKTPGHWSQWRGPERSGICAGPAWPERVSDENLRKQWRIELGPSYSGPIVDGGRVYTTETVDEEWEVVRALDRKTGEEIWQHRWEGAMQVPFFARRNGSWIRSTPALAGGKLYVAGMRERLVCLDAESGAEEWNVDLADRFETPLESFGFVCSPLVVGDHVYVQAAAGLVKLDRHSGETVWRGLEERGGMMGGAFSSPVFANVAGVDQLLVQTRSRLCGVDDATGEELWGVSVRTFRAMNILTPQPWKNGVFTSAYGGRAHFFEVARDDDGAWSVAEKWTNRAQGYMTSPVVIDDHAYLYLRSKRFACVDLEAGEVAWISPPMGDTYWSLVAQGDRILALTDVGELLLIRHDPEKLDIIDRHEVADGETWAHLAVDGGQLFVRERGALAAYAWGARPTGAIR